MISRRFAAAALAILVGGVSARGSESPVAEAPAADAPKECTPAAGSELPLGVKVVIPHGQLIGGAVVRVDYPADKVMLPGSGPVNGPGQGIKVLVEGASSATNDLGTGVRVMVAQAGVMRKRDLLTITFQGCDGAAAAKPADFSCTVEQVRDPAGNSVKDATCEVFARTAGAAPEKS
jgi:hypothetical protein